MTGHSFAKTLEDGTLDALDVFSEGFILHTLDNDILCLVIQLTRSCIALGVSISLRARKTDQHCYGARKFEPFLKSAEAL